MLLLGCAGQSKLWVLPPPCPAQPSRGSAGSSKPPALCPAAGPGLFERTLCGDDSQACEGDSGGWNHGWAPGCSALAVRVSKVILREAAVKGPLSSHLPSTWLRIHVTQPHQGLGSYSPSTCCSVWLCRATQPRWAGAARERVPQQLCMPSSLSSGVWEGWLHCYLYLGHHCFIKNLK